MLFLVNHSQIKSTGEESDPGHTQEGLKEMHSIKNTLEGFSASWGSVMGPITHIVTSVAIQRCLEIAKKMKLSFKDAPICDEKGLGGPGFKVLSEDPDYVRGIWPLMRKIGRMEPTDGHKIVCCRRQVPISLFKAHELEKKREDIPGGSIYMVDPGKERVWLILPGAAGFYDPAL